MDSTELKARAKINLSLDVLGRRPDGYHDVKMVMQTIELHDRIFIEVIEKGIEIECSAPWVPNDKGNIAYKAAEQLIERFGIKKGVKIRIDKNIPVAAGLAGGSSDAAAVLKGMNSLFKLDLTEKELMDIGKTIGADVPFCIRGGTMLAEGIGEILTQLDPLPVTNIVLIKPKIGVSTAWVYENLNVKKLTSRPNTNIIINSIANGNIKKLAQNMKNVLETVTSGKYEVIGEIKQKLVELGALGSMMSGSGPTVFGIFSDKAAAMRAYEAMESNRWDRYITTTVSP
ncbi:4-(cytidine 5'-diphospho)-2-C-methyl-D-erythritol kinase [Clostridium thermosuccinogenes]|uniref:4-diphosphocytidyl-2-C-methyl-D-erythritol kinase n=1 Tax=Clostridium thermosuccinogenes TaxID=84032 RepID=A0A2K2FE71_9CLOT|nr:4-(cytidine 5'-diphospho)-2-C-methyl-D-erythritol kinase [Pseudoclostridium thermosuccinogenes]AUS98466.1 4-(cytidine 5'-diphospho)-2-C-methyl-D-erythritol kinase [Pseudoclostridium thermosuccinogenes]PNT90868.1 4-(cytidine 5'-diphospho)-2-C-methyl-D-erythritol kinase [Pseudoclostridium thermosuccinogenes]PNT97081.1 4-(cytidine 5'-diphospho)-2-C-methyl-D-erythritol kinase [Pseudoclostridium thermosuccinogenes]PNT99012.1 4-(cytidine 5'-diphospho)-2-C-methyl-D-erythritol kinase [Pseudoclostrid